MKRIIEYIMIVAFFIGAFGLIVYASSLYSAIAVFGIVCLSTAFLVCGVFLAINDA